jgi:pyruvate/2-oxoglutarate/acetoin dehydrogenase E1 component
MSHFSLQAAQALQDEGIDAEVLDLRSLWPLDLDLIFGSIRKTGRVVIVEEGPKQGGVGAEIAAEIAESIPDSLIAPIVRVAAPNTPVPFSPVLEKRYVPQPTRIADAVRALVGRY